MRDSRTALAPPTSMHPGDSLGSKGAARPLAGPASAQKVHAALAAQDALAKAPRPVAQADVGATPAAPSDNPTKDLSAATAVKRLENYGGKLDQQIDEQSQ